MLTDWLVGGGVLALLVMAWLDIRKQTIAGSVPTEFTKTVLERLEKVEEDQKQERKENEAYRQKAKTWFADVSSVMRSHGIDVPPPPDGFPV